MVKRKLWSSAWQSDCFSARGCFLLHCITSLWEMLLHLLSSFSISAVFCDIFIWSHLHFMSAVLTEFCSLLYICFPAWKVFRHPSTVIQFVVHFPVGLCFVYYGDEQKHAILKLLREMGLIPLRLWILPLSLCSIRKAKGGCKSHFLYFFSRQMWATWGQLSEDKRKK